ncbi:MAG: VOC family protein [Thermodesulfobacteriota bacterium]
MARVLDHIVLNVEDVERIIAFYCEVLGLPPERLEEFRAGKVSFPSVRIHKDTVIDLFPKSLWEQTEPKIRGRSNLNHFCLALVKKEWDELRQRLDQHRVSIEVGPVNRWGAHGTGISIYFTDPEGNLIEVRYYERKLPSNHCLLES